MSNASYALVLLLASGAVGELGMWQLLAGTSRSAELANVNRCGTASSRRTDCIQ